MAETRVACEKAYDPSASVSENLVSLVLAIRAELFRRADNVAALDLYHFALKNMPAAAVSHHRHRAALVERIIGASEQTIPVLDALRGFTDPDLLLATEAQDTEYRVGALCVLLAAKLDCVH